MANEIRVTVYESWNGFAGLGAYVAKDKLYRVISRDSRIQTDRHANYMYMTVVECDWSECESGEEHPCRVEVGC